MIYGRLFSRVPAWNDGGFSPDAISAIRIVGESIAGVLNDGDIALVDCTEKDIVDSGIYMNNTCRALKRPCMPNSCNGARMALFWSLIRTRNTQP